MKSTSETLRSMAKRASLLMLGSFAILPAVAGPEAGTYSTTANSMSYILVGTALFQMIFIIVIASIMKNLSRSTDVWSKFKKNGGAGSLLALLTVPMFGFTSGADVPFLLMKVNDLFWLLVSVNIILFLIVVVMLGIVRGMIGNMRGEEELVAVVEEEPDLLASVTKSLTKVVDIEHEEDILLDHEYDGIHELDNVLPPWWLWMFYGTVGFAVVYIMMYHIFAVWPLQGEEYEIAMEEGRQQVAAYNASLKDRVDENSVVLLTDEKALKNGEEIYTSLCVACHGTKGEGGIGPNFTDEFWLHGCDIKDLFSTVKYGVPEKGMISWKTQLKPPEMQNVSSYILSRFQTGTPVAGGKEPQGEACIGSGSEDVPEDDAAPADTTVTNDTLVTAMLR